MQNTRSDGEASYVNPALLSSGLLRHLGHMIDDLSMQGLVVWFDDEDQWHWRWRGTRLCAAEGLSGLGEAIADAVATRFPTYFEHPPLLDRAVSG